MRSLCPFLGRIMLIGSSLFDIPVNLKFYYKMSNQVQGKEVAIIAHITFIGFIIALIMNSSNKTEFGSFHLRQTLGLWLTLVVGGWIPFVNFLILPLGFIMWVVGLINAINGYEKPMPILGRMYSQWFRSI